MARTRAQDYEAKREAILHESAELFARFGYPGTSISMIAEACNMSKALLYHYYSDKEAVLFDILSSHLEQLIGSVEAAVDAAPADQRIHAIVAALLEAYRDADAEHQVQISNLKLLPEDRQATLRAMERRLVTLLADAIVAEVPEVGRGALLKPLTMSAFGMLNWHYLWFREGMGLTRADYAWLVTDLLKTGAVGAVQGFAKGKTPSAVGQMSASSRPKVAGGLRRSKASSAVKSRHEKAAPTMKGGRPAE